MAEPDQVEGERDRHGRLAGLRDGEARDDSQRDRPRRDLREGERALADDRQLRARLAADALLKEVREATCDRGLRASRPRLERVSPGLPDLRRRVERRDALRVLEVGLRLAGQGQIGFVWIEAG